MKKLILIAICFVSLQLSAQGNLQFNQVLLLDASNPANAVSVPVGKVWKIESVALSNNNAYVQLEIGGTNFFLANSSVPFEHFPYWVPGGTSLGLYGSAPGKLSVIEFNVVP